MYAISNRSVLVKYVGALVVKISYEHIFVAFLVIGGRLGQSTGFKVASVLK
jgi:hypothetical protein